MKLKTAVLRSIPIALVFLALPLPASAVAAQQAGGRAASAANLVTHVSLSPGTPNILRLNQNVTVNFSYTTNEAGGVRIWARPFSGGALTPNYAASGSPLYPVGSGTGSGSFTITSGNPTVTKIRFQMWNASGTTLLFETFIPVSYQFKSAAQVVSKIRLTATPNVLKHGQKVSVSFRYKATTPGGVRIFARPISGAALTPHYAAHASKLYRPAAGRAAAGSRSPAAT